MIVTDATVGLAEWIIDDTLVMYIFWPTSPGHTQMVIIWTNGFSMFAYCLYAHMENDIALLKTGPGGSPLIRQLCSISILQRKLPISSRFSTH